MRPKILEISRSIRFSCRAILFPHVPPQSDGNPNLLPVRRIRYFSNNRLQIFIFLNNTHITNRPRPFTDSNTTAYYNQKWFLPHNTFRQVVQHCTLTIIHFRHLYPNMSDKKQQSMVYYIYRQSALCACYRYVPDIRLK